MKRAFLMTVFMALTSTMAMAKDECGGGTDVSSASKTQTQKPGGEADDFYKPSDKE